MSVIWASVLCLIEGQDLARSVNSSVKPVCSQWLSSAPHKLYQHPTSRSQGFVIQSRANAPSIYHLCFLLCGVPKAGITGLEANNTLVAPELHSKSPILRIIPSTFSQYVQHLLESAGTDTDDNYYNYKSTKHMFPVKALRIIVKHKSVIPSVTVCVGLHVCISPYVHA